MHTNVTFDDGGEAVGPPGVWSVSATVDTVILAGKVGTDETWTGVVRNICSLVTHAKCAARAHVTAAEIAPSTIDPTPRREERSKPDELRPAAVTPSIRSAVANPASVAAGLPSTDG